MKKPLTTPDCVREGIHLTEQYLCQCFDEPENDSECLLLILRELRRLAAGTENVVRAVHGVASEQAMQNRYGGNRY